MRITILALAMIAAVGLASYPMEGSAQMGRGGGHGYGMGHGMMGGGMMHGAGGRGMMGPGYRSTYDFPSAPSYNPPSQQRKPLEEKDARARVKDYLASTRNPNLKVGKIEDRGSVFGAEILTNDDSLVDRIVVDKRTGAMRSVYR